MNAPVRSMPRFASVAEAIERLKPVQPVYLLFPDRFRAAARRFLDGFPGDALYAVKANPTHQALDQIWAAGIRHFDTASLGEIELVKKRFPDAICHFMTPVRMPGAAAAASTTAAGSPTKATATLTLALSCSSTRESALWPTPATARPQRPSTQP